MPVLQGPSSGSGEAPKQHSQPSRKGKKAWRKNVDVTEVQKGLEELNDEIIRGGVIKEKPSAELFAIDVARAPKEKSQSKHGKKLLKADEIIARRSAVPAVSMRKRPGDKTTDGLLPTKRQRTDWVPHKELARLRKVADGQHDTTVVAKDATYDIWDAPVESVAAKTFDFLPEKQSAKAPKSMKQAPLSLTATGKHVAAVQTPNGGYSYNPAFTDYETRLAEESAKALEAEKKRLAAEEDARLKQEAAARSAAEAEAAEERANMSEWEEDSEWEGFQSGVEDEKPAQKQAKRKTQAQRNRIKRRKEEERLAKHKVVMKERRVQEQRIKAIADEVEERDRQRALALAEDSDSATELTDEKLRRKQLGKFKLPEKDLELVLPDELQESLRLLKPEGNLLKDRYRSMLVRGKVESRRHIPFKRQAKRKLTEKWTHKDFVL
ncbi:60S ribosome subunit biogenesis protein NOP53 [Purpureocillium lavendulum]|uniref:Ribosome biogenesis protein NOP53 n=1 Tax=Purpureocillium lavendulum TaxID=1247861 RepID=A0AB34FVM2_9HYPO|nr:60S ribosome subunit biogenesis protein NOP53 [Purpureocillium lavendulum]